MTPNPESWLSRAAAAEALTAAGFPTSVSLLAMQRRDGPRYRLNAGVAEYQWQTVLAWRQSRVKYRGGDPSDAPKAA